MKLIELPNIVISGILWSIIKWILTIYNNLIIIESQSSWIENHYVAFF